MVRTQIQLTEEQARMLRELADSRRESVAATIRKAIDRFLLSAPPDRTSLYRQAGYVVGKYRSEKADVSVEHDRYLEESFRA